MLKSARTGTESLPLIPGPLLKAQTHRQPVLYGSMSDLKMFVGMYPEIHP